MTRRLHQLLADQADRRPEALAVAWGEQRESFSDLDRSSNRLARALRDAGCSAGDRVALLLPKSPRALTAMFGSLKADCIYVPVDTSSPSKRIERILNLCECRCVVAESSASELLRQLIASDGWNSSTRIIWADRAAELDCLPDTPLDSRAALEHPAHILFTSGSTGTPKGVAITHSNILEFVNWAVRYFNMAPGDRVSGHAPLHFDLSTFDVYGSVAAGAELHLVPPEMNLLPHKLAGFMHESRLNQWFSVPSVLHNLARFDAVKPGDLPELKRVLWCGDKLATPDLRYWMQRIPHAAYFNLYGPTETTIASSCYRVPECPADDRAEIPIGTPCWGERLMVLDRNLNPAATGETGDLYIGGAGLSPGYWRDESRTAEVFRRLDSGDRIYKTGDLARIGADGQLYLIGRADTQIKTRGYRIELGEIEAALGTCPNVVDAAVVAVDPPNGEAKEICCAFVPASGTGCSATILKQHLSEQLPRYMIPAHWKALESMPRNANGKTDRPALRQLFLAQQAGRAVSSLV